MTRTLVLWDIDNTLLYTGGAGMVGMRRAFADLYGIDDSFQRIEFSGRTDTAIFRDAAAEHGMTEATARADMPRFIDAYVPHLTVALHEVKGGALKPGVRQVLDALTQRDDVVQGLGTGNFRRAAEAKVRHFEVAEYFPDCVGGFGEDSHDRHEVIGLGIERLRNGGQPERIVIIGDTPHDVTAAKANGAFALAVATGRDSVADLVAAGADVALTDLSDVERVLDIICG
jgi:phosphoglycolate phosphatase-like HAD superfamily hydrolase